MTQEIITITVEAGQMTARRKSRKIDQRRPVPVWAIVKYAALTIAGIMLFREGAARALVCPVTTADLKRAFMDERPVRYNGITYQRVTAVIYRKTPDKTGLLVQGELLDKNGRAVMIAAAERIEVEEPK